MFNANYALTCVKSSSISKQTESSFHLSLGDFQNNFRACSAFGKSLHHCLQMEQNEIPADACHLGVLSGVSKMIPSLWYVRHKPCTYLASRLAQSPNKPNRASTWASSPRTTIGACKKWFLILWYVWGKPCTYLVLIQTLPPNGPKWDSTRPTSPRSSMRCVPNNIRAYVTFGTNHAPILR
jgi:hypothetical protein